MPCLHFDLRTYVPGARCLTSCALEGFSFFFGSPCTLRDLDDAMNSPHFNMTLSRPLCLHVDWGLESNACPCVPTDQGPRGPCQVDPTYQKPCRPASGPGDLIHNPVTLDDSKKPYLDPGGSTGLGGQGELLDHGLAPLIGPQIAGYSL
jgi:hypothetical protein